jgi:hypothetical protein
LWPPPSAAVPYLDILRPGEKKNWYSSKEPIHDKKEEINPHEPFRYSKTNAIFV